MGPRSDVRDPTLQFSVGLEVAFDAVRTWSVTPTFTVSRWNNIDPARDRREAPNSLDI
jgi:hypothetical protein